MWGAPAGFTLNPFDGDATGEQMGRSTGTGIIFMLTGLLAAMASGRAIRQVDHGYSPSTWVTSICLPDDVDKPLVHKDGSLLYDYKTASTSSRVCLRNGSSPWRSSR